MTTLYCVSGSLKVPESYQSEWNLSAEYKNFEKLRSRGLGQLVSRAGAMVRRGAAGMAHWIQPTCQSFRGSALEQAKRDLLKGLAAIHKVSLPTEAFPDLTPSQEAASASTANASGSSTAILVEQ
eukprot:4091841-Alexandrium_andersonii.AAC.1